MLNEAPCAIVVCGDTSRERHKSYWVQDCSAATQNMLLMAAEMGLGSVWLGVYLREERVSELRKLLDIPDNIIPLNIVAIGHPAEEKGPSDDWMKQGYTKQVALKPKSLSPVLILPR